MVILNREDEIIPSLDELFEVFRCCFTGYLVHILDEVPLSEQLANGDQVSLTFPFSSRNQTLNSANFKLISDVDQSCANTID